MHMKQQQQPINRVSGLGLYSVHLLECLFLCQVNITRTASENPQEPIGCWLHPLSWTLLLTFQLQTNLTSSVAIKPISSRPPVIRIQCSITQLVRIRPDVSSVTRNSATLEHWYLITEYTTARKFTRVDIVTSRSQPTWVCGHMSTAATHRSANATVRLMLKKSYTDVRNVKDILKTVMCWGITYF